MATYLRSGFRGTCTSPGSGTGPYTSIAAVAGYRSFATLTDGDTILVGVRSATTWGETGVYTKSGGATPTLTRTRIDETINGNTSPVDWTAGTPLVIYSTVDGVDTASLLGANTWQADQSFNGKKLRLSADGNSYVDSPSNASMELVVANAAHTLLAKGGSGESYLQVQWADNGALPGPVLVLDRLSTSPSINDLLGFVQFSGRNSSGTSKVYGSITSRIRDPAAGSEDGAYDVTLLRAGSVIPAFELNDHNAIFFATFQEAATGVYVGKNSGVFSDVGVELRSDGSIASTVQDQSTLYLNRKGSDGTLVGFYRDGTVIGSISVAGGVVAYNTFMGAHYSEWHSSVADAASWEEPGTVVCTADGTLPGFGGRLPLVVPSTFAGDKRVYGAVHARLSDSFLQIAGLGAAMIKVTGYVEAGDWLETSDTPGAARAQVSEYKTNATVAKATQSSPDDGTVRLCPCTLEAG